MTLVQQYLPHSARLFLGLTFSVFGLNGFLHFLPAPEVPVTAGQFLGGLAATGYMFPLIKGVEVAGGVLLLSNRFVPLALTLLAPITVNILLFHAVLAPGLALPIALITAQLFLAYAYRERFAPMLAKEAKPAPIGNVAGQRSEGPWLKAHRS